MSLGKKKILAQGAAGGVVNTDNFAPVTYTGNDTTNRQIDVDFKPDFIWLKNRSAATNHILVDSTRGANNLLFSDATSAALTTNTTLLSSINDSGFTVGYDGTDVTNGANNNYVAWCWKAGGAAVSNTDGSITSSVSANPDAGFSIVKAQGTGTYPTINTVGHGLNQAPEMIIVKDIDQVAGWLVYHTGLTDSTGYLTLNATSAEQTDTNAWGNQEPTSSIFAITNGWTINTNSNFIAYCFHSVDGYQKVGSYSGSNSPISITTGFQPRFLLTKRTDASGNSWVIIDSAREIGSGADALFPDLSVAESSGWNTSFDSNGFTISSNESYVSAAGGTYIYLAIA